MSDFRVFETVQFLDDLEKISGLVYPQLSEQPYFGTNIKKLKEKIVFMVAANTRQQSY